MKQLLKVTWLGSNKGKIRTQTWPIPANQKPHDSVHPEGRMTLEAVLS